MPRRPIWFALGLALTMSVPLTNILLVSVVELLHAGKIPLLNGHLFTSRAVFPAEFYVEITQRYRNFIVVLQALVGAAILVTAALGYPISDFIRHVAESLEGKQKSRSAALALVAGSNLLGVLLLGGPYFSTNDDARFAANLSGAHAGVPDPRTGFIGRTLAHALVVLAELVPGLAWWGLTLFTGQVVAVLVLFHLVLRTARSNLSQPLWWLALASIGAFSAYSTLFLQFTQVAISLGGAAMLVLVVRTSTGDYSLVRASALPLFLIMLSTEIRSNGIILALGVVGCTFLFPKLVSGWKTALAPAGLAIGFTLFAFFISSPGETSRIVPVESGWSAPLSPEQACVGETQSSSWRKVAAANVGPLSANDKALISRWVRPTSALFGTDAASRNDGGIPARLAPSADCGLFRSPEARLPGRMTLLGIAVAVAAALSVRMARRVRAVSVLAATGLHGLLLALAVVTRAPMRVVLPALVVGAVGLTLGTLPSADCKNWKRFTRPKYVIAACVASFLLPIFVGVELVTERLHRASDDEQRRSDFVELLRRTGGKEGGQILSWLDPLNESHRALAVPWAVEEGRPIGIAGWGTALSLHEELLEARGLVDWVGSVADNTDVLLVAHRRDVNVFLQFLVERRGFSCATPVVVAEGGPWIVVSEVLECPESLAKRTSVVAGNH